MELKAHKKHILKSFSWRFFGTVDTVLLSWLITGDAWIGLKIGVAEVITKLVLYYFHERFWHNYPIQDRYLMPLVKTVSWRFVGTLDTFVLAWIATGNPLTGLKIGLVEFFTKMLLYYIHEIIWDKYTHSNSIHDNKTLTL